MSTIQVLTRIATDWARRCFGDEHVSNPQVRSLRHLEETTELSQALGLPRETALLCVNRVYDRPVGEIEQEIGGSLLTGVVLCEALGKDPEEMLEREVRRVLKKSPEHFAKRNQEKIDIGLDASAHVPGGTTDERTAHRAAVEAGYAPLKEYVETHRSVPPPPGAQS